MRISFLPSVTAVALATALSACSSKPAAENAAAPGDADVNVTKLAQEVRVVPFPSADRLEGYLVEDVEPNTAWTRLGIRRGDLIVSVGGEPIGKFATNVDLFRAVEHPGSKRVEVVRRSGQHATPEHLTLPPPK